MKRIVDILLSSVGLVVLFPIGLLVAMGLKLTSPGPVFFRQVRAGRGGREFRIFKFRTMVVQASEVGPQFTAGGDSRITPFGTFLRRHKLDELPQLINVLRGEMALVGPRPEVVEFVEMFPTEYARILKVRPGITHPVTILFRSEEQILALAADSRRFFIDTLMPEKLAAYAAHLELGLAEAVRTIVATVLPDLRPRWAPKTYTTDHFAAALSAQWGGASDDQTVVANIPAYPTRIPERRRPAAAAHTLGTVAQAADHVATL